jgi:hypothetical protein
MLTEHFALDLTAADWIYLTTFNSWGTRRKCFGTQVIGFSFLSCRYLEVSCVNFNYADSNKSDQWMPSQLGCVQFATIVTYIMKIHIMEVMNFCLHKRNLFREMLRRYWKRRLQNCLWCQEIQIQSTSWVWWTQFLYLNLPLLLCFCRLCFKSRRVHCNSTRMVQRHMFMVLEGGDLWFST